MATSVPLAGRIALVTGVSRRNGIGAALTRRLLADGARVYASGWPPHDDEMARDAEGAGREALLAHLGGEGERLVVRDADLAQPDAPARLVDEVVAHYGAIDVVIANHARSTTMAPQRRVFAGRGEPRRPPDPLSLLRECAPRGVRLGRGSQSSPSSRVACSKPTSSASSLSSSSSPCTS